MCGRFALYDDIHKIKEQFNVENVPDFDARYNIPPSSQVLCILEKNNKKVAELMHWGLIPFWAKDKKTSSKLINARAETIHEKPAFRNAFKNNHCIKVMSGFLNGKMKVVKSSPIISKTLTTNYWLSHQFGRNGKIKKMKDSSEAVA